MGTHSVKDRLIDKINSIEDEVFLNELEDIILNLSNENEAIVVLSDEIKAAIAKSEIDIVEGRTISHENAMQHFKECLKNK